MEVPQWIQGHWEWGMLTEAGGLIT